MISKSSQFNVNLYLLDDWLETNLNRIPNEYINFEKFIKKYNFIKLNNFQSRMKRFGDVLLSISLLFITLPILFLAGIIIWITDKGPIIYKQKKRGQRPLLVCSQVY